MNQLVITQSIISYNHQVIKTSNISSVDLKEYNVGNNRPLVALGIVFALLALYSFKTMPKAISLDILICAIATLFFYANYRYKKENHCYFIDITTNSGAKKLFSHKDYDFINDIRMKMQEALDATGTAFNVTYNLDNKTIINTTGNVAITNITQYQELSENDKDYLKTFFEPALQRLQNEVSKNNSEEMKRNFDMLKQELKSSKPRKAILDAAWSVVGNIGTLADIAGIIEKGINMF